MSSRDWGSMLCEFKIGLDGGDDRVGSFRSYCNEDRNEDNEADMSGYSGEVSEGERVMMKRLRRADSRGRGING